MSCRSSTRSISQLVRASAAHDVVVELGGRVVELFVGIDWAEDHHDVCVMDERGKVAAKGRVGNDLAGLARVHDLVASAVPDDVEDEDVEVVVGIETDRGLLVRALVAAGYRVLAVNPLAVDRYRDRARVSGAKSDPGDARVLADMARTDAHQHRPVAADSELADAIKLVARSHQSAIWSRRRLAGACPGPRSLPPCGAGAAGSTSNAAPQPSRAPCGASTWPSRPPSPAP